MNTYLLNLVKTGIRLPDELTDLILSYVVNIQPIPRDDPRFSMLQYRCETYKSCTFSTSKYSYLSQVYIESANILRIIQIFTSPVKKKVSFQMLIRKNASTPIVQQKFGHHYL